MMPDGAELVFDADEIAAAVTRVADALSRRCGEADPLLLSVLLGALPFTAALVPKLAFEHTLDTVQVSRYRSTVRGGALHWLHRPTHRPAGRMVVLLDDVLDDGETLRALRTWCLREGATAVIAAVLVRKASSRRAADVDADIVGLEAGADYLFGFGMDYRERLRELPDIHRLPTTEEQDD